MFPQEVGANHVAFLRTQFPALHLLQMGRAGKYEEAIDRRRVHVFQETEITEEEVMLGDVLTYAVDTVEMKPKEAREWASDQAQKGNTPKQMLAILKTSNEPPV